MRKKVQRTTETVIEVDELLVVSHSESIRRWCAMCGGEVEMFSPEAAALIAGTTSREIYRQVEAGLVHFDETAPGLLYICPNSTSTRKW